MTPHQTDDRTRGRHGANALEFAMVMPIFVLLTMGMIDFGYYYSRQSQIVGALTSAATTGTTRRPASNDAYGCTPCANAVESHAREALTALGVEVNGMDLRPEVRQISDACGLVLQVSVPHQALLGFVPVAESHEVTVVANAEFVEYCSP